MTANGWTDERKARQAEAIHRWKPWSKSTGPKTEAGKATVARNARKHGQRSREAISERRAIMRIIKQFEAGVPRSV